MSIEEEIWLSDPMDEEEERFLNSQDPSAFGLALTHQGGVAGGYHVRNRPGERQRTTFSAFHGGPQKKPAFTVSCEAKAIIHGAIAGEYGKRATLLVVELNFLSRRGTRIKEANILFEFRNGSEGSPYPEVVAIRPSGVSKMEETREALTANEAMSFNLTPGLPGVDAGVTMSGERSRSRESRHYTTIVGENQPDPDFGYHTQPRFMLQENPSQKTGIPSRITIPVLLERENDDDFIMIPYIEVTPKFTLSTLMSSLSSTRSSDDPVIFSVEEAAFNRLDPSVVIDENNLGSVNMDRLWDCTMFNLDGEGIKRNSIEEGGVRKH